MKDLRQEIKNIKTKITNQEKKLEEAHKELTAILHIKSENKKYSFKNIISFGLFNFFKNKKLNQDIKYFKGEIDHFEDKSSWLKNEMIKKYKELLTNVAFNNNMKLLSQEIEKIEYEIMELDKQIPNIVSEIEPLHQKLQSIASKTKKYISIKKIVNLFKKKKLNQKIIKLFSKMTTIGNEKSKLRSGIIEKYQQLVNITFNKTKKYASIATNINNIPATVERKIQRRNSI